MKPVGEWDRMIGSQITQIEIFVGVHLDPARIDGLPLPLLRNAAAMTPSR
jgi:hypothetical protein